MSTLLFFVMKLLLYFLFFCSGVSGLIFEIAWVREFGNLSGNTVYSTAVVMAVSLLGLGVGGYAAGALADRRYATQPESLLKTYGQFQLAIAALAIGISFSLPYLSILPALASSYTRSTAGWYELSTLSYLVRGTIAVMVLAPPTLLMGGSLTLLIRHLVHRDFERETSRIAIIYGAGAAGAALGAFVTDFAIVPTMGLRAAQMVAVLLNLVVAAGAWLLASRVPPADTPAPLVDPLPAGSRVIAFTGVALALSGFAAMGMGILWFRHFTLLLGGFRAVFSLLLTIILIGVGAGSLLASFLIRRTKRPAEWLIATLGLFVAFSLYGLAAADLGGIDAVAALVRAPDGTTGTFTDLLLNVLPIVLEVGAPALLMGFVYPLANAVVQRAEPAVGRCAGVLYFSNTIGAACGVLAGGLVLLPRFGMQGTATILAVATGLAMVPLVLAARASAPGVRLTVPARLALASVTLLGCTVFGLWLRLPADHVITGATAYAGPNARMLALTEGVSQVVAVTEVPGEGRRLLTDGHPLLATNRLSQRYMRALAHIPLLLIDQPGTVLVIGFGVGNTAHAATLHPSIRRIEVAEFSNDVLAHAGDFTEANKDVLGDRRMAVYLNDGRQHLRLQSAASYDLIALEPPSPALAGAGALYSTEFYALARTRLKPGGYVSQWLPAYQVPVETLGSMIRAFVDVFPQAVLLGGTDEELLLLGTNDSRIEADPERLTAALARAPAVQADLRRIDLGSVREIVGTFMASAQTLTETSRSAAPVTDDWPMQEYGATSRLTWIRLSGVPESLVDLSQAAAWCPRCFAGGTPTALVSGLDRYLALLDPLYRRLVPPADGPGSVTDPQTERFIRGSPYLRDVLAELTLRRNARGAALVADGKYDEAIEEFRNALRFNQNSAETYWNLGRALEFRGASLEAIEQLRRSVALDPALGPVRYDLGHSLLVLHENEEAEKELRAAVRLMPNSAEAHNNLGIALGSQGKLGEAINEFREALRLQPDSASAKENLAMALTAAGPTAADR
ncbi:MAG: tetratricopeptide repeat protein [Vicinamibacterales bacterium]